MTIDEMPPEWLFRVCDRMHHCMMTREFELRGLSKATHPFLLFALREEGSGQALFQKEIAERLGVAQPTAAVSIRRMVPYFDDIRKGLGPILRKRVAGFSSYRIGVVLFKDYWPEEYITRKFPFTSDISKIEEIVRAASVRGGGDIPEALYEALFSAVTDFDWSADRRQIIFLTDAAPHPQARGTIELSDVLGEAKRRKVEIDAIVEPTANPATNKPHPDFENAAHRIEALGAIAAKPRLLVLSEGDDAQSWAKEATDRLVSGPIAMLSPICYLLSIGHKTNNNTQNR